MNITNEYTELNQFFEELLSYALIIHTLKEKMADNADVDNDFFICETRINAFYEKHITEFNTGEIIVGDKTTLSLKKDYCALIESILFTLSKDDRKEFIIRILDKLQFFLLECHDVLERKIPFLPLYLTRKMEYETIGIFWHTNKALFDFLVKIASVFNEYGVDVIKYIDELKDAIDCECAEDEMVIEGNSKTIGKRSENETELLYKLSLEYEMIGLCEQNAFVDVFNGTVSSNKFKIKNKNLLFVFLSYRVNLWGAEKADETEAAILNYFGITQEYYRKKRGNLDSWTDKQKSFDAKIGTII